MNSAEQLNNFLDRITSDENLTASHISICAALIFAWVNNSLKSPFRVSRKKLMIAAKIKSTTTYHKVIADLALLKYVKYNPSYHPGKGSQISIL